MDAGQFIWSIFLASLTVSQGQFLRCPRGQWQCDDGNCVPEVWRCDGRGDCLDGSDEMDCSGSADCPAGQFPCVDSVGCVDASARCDGRRQCPTGSDEEGCRAVHGCLESDWTCRNHMCIPREQRCDGLNDCLDNSDEEDCGVCGEGDMRCPEGVCVAPKERCDGQFHCSDGSDEPITCGRLCAVNNGGCSHVCADEAWGALCACPVGYKLSPNGAVCEDLDECAQPFGPCMHHCTNTVGSYYCHCRDGFQLSGSSACLATGDAVRLLTVQRKSMGLLNVESQRFEVIQTLVLDPVALTLDVARGWYYWADNRGSIYRSDGQHSSTVFNGEPGIKGLACDWLNGNLFWTNQKTASIYMQAADGNSYTTLLSKSTVPSELVLLPVESLMFWISAGNGDRVTIEKSWMDGSGRSSLTVLTAQSAHSLTADTAARRLYWISDFKRSVETVKVDGTGRFSFTRLFSRRPALSLAVFGSFFYWVDDKGLWQVPQNQPGQKKFMWKAALPILSVYHELQQPQGSSACAEAPCQLCQLTKDKPAGFTCACPPSKVLLPDGTCEYPRFLYATSTNINMLEFRGSESTKTQLFAADDGILSFDLDWNMDWLYWANQTGHVQRTSLTQVKTEVVPTPLPVCMIKIHQKTGSLYWVSCDQNSIGTTTADGRRSQQLYDTEKEILDIFVDWLRGNILWLEDERIFTMSMMGSKVRELLHLRGLRGNIAFDLRANSLLWNSERAGLTTMSLLQERSHQAGRRWNISGSVMVAFEPFLLSLSDDVMTLWDRRDGNPIQDMRVRGHVLGVIAALRDVHTVPSPPVCNESSVLCRQTSACISQAQLCDGKKDCPDGNDEDFCVVTCPSEDGFRCKDRRSCVSKSLVCDGRSHCHDGSDEVDCPSVTPAASGKVLKCRMGSRQCGDGTECVLYSHVCDGEKDCRDGSDEEGCAAEVAPTTAAESVHINEPPAPTKPFPEPPTKPPCTSPSLLCPHSSLCIKPAQLCDGKRDCPDGSDESCVKRCPYKTDFRCKDRRSCVSKSLVCDGRSHCADGSDEVDCPTVASPGARPNILKCRTGSKACKDGTECVLYSHVCDGEKDCRDGSDEEECDAPVETSPDKNPTKPNVDAWYEAPPAATVPTCSSPAVPCPHSAAHICISPKQFCNGQKDCPDGFDEQSCVKRCPSKDDFRCKDRRSCVSKSLVCDGRSHCHDGSDEVDCPSVTPAASGKVLKCRMGSRPCGDGTECVLYSHVCDGEKDCRDGSDEEGCAVEAAEVAPTTAAESVHINEPPAPTKPFPEPPTKPPCTSPSLLCPHSSLCIKPAQLCDGKRDCPDGSDESCVKRCPYKTDFRCKDRRSCVSKSLVCDGRSHCADGSDEVDCPTVASPGARPNILKCRTGSKACKDGTECVLYSHVCDGEKDCRDGSDEEECDAPVETSPDKNPTKPNVDTWYEAPPAATVPTCSSPAVPCPHSAAHICISPKQFCNGQKDCPDGFDEQSCVKRCPSKDDFRCKDRRSCVSKSLVCDGRSHCHDGSDEVDCPSVTPAASGKVLKCRMGSRPCGDGTECVLYSHVCDGEKDCKDGSDEEGCAAEVAPTTAAESVHINEPPAPTKPFPEPPTKPPCTSPSLLCPHSSLCIKPAQLCDGKRDCPDGSDESCVKRCPYKTDFRCKDRRSCVSKSLVCDGRSHCADGSDEVDCPTVASPGARPNILKCRTGSKACKDGTECVLYSHVCDGEKDCRDGSDEEECDAPVETSPDKNPTKPNVDAWYEAPPAATVPTCSSPAVPCPHSAAHICISPKQFCNGQKDCPDGFDEQSCVKRCPSKDDFRCKDRRSCVSKSLVCDGRSHCHDGSDEVDCPSVTPAASGKVLKCRMGSRPCGDGTECVLYSHVCDGEKDCRDGSDEEGCAETCKQGEFQCSHGKMCIPGSQVCDGRSQCRDQSDELNCREQTKSCEHRCADGNRCIPTKFLCDGERDCLDGTDEVGCDPITAAATTESPIPPSTSPCIAPSVLCPGSSLCISQNQLCDGQPDCPDGFDENDCLVQCKNPDDFLCSDRRMCVPSTQVCDGRSHCPDGSDEKQCQSADPAALSSDMSAKPAPLRCRKGFKPCEDGLECVMYSHVCDGEKDCQDGSDERGCAAQCKADEFQCAHGNRCIRPEQVCDGQSDCQDQSDEKDCSHLIEGCHQRCDNNTRCVPQTFLCDGERDCADGSDEEKCGLVACAIDQYRCASGQCVSEALRCDGYADCSDRSDEMECTRPPRCPVQLRCRHSHECLQKEWLCDGEDDCKDGEDEKNCMLAPANCREYQWQCGDGDQCIPLSWRCDGKEDCYNGVDEDKCSQRKCPLHLYQCGSGECVEAGLVCNGFTNCADSSDEGVGCAQHNCSSQSAPQCDHRCVSTPNGPRCYCAAGFKLQSSAVSCVDIDECSTAPHAVCKHSCLNTRGSYVCQCHPGFYLEPDNKSCKTKDEPLLLASVQSELLLLGVRSSNLRLLSSVNRPVFSLDYHWAQQRVYWLSPDYQSIRWADMKNPNNKGTLIKGVKSDFIAVDWIGKNLYWVDGLVGQILAVKLSDTTVRSQGYTVVLGEDLEQPSSLVLLPHRGLMLWSEIGSTPQIERSGMDGSKRKVIVSRGLSWPVSLAYDLLDSRVYWTDEKLRCIGSASLDGDDVKILQLAETPSPFSVAIFNDRLFWSDTKRRTIRSADKNTGKDQKVLLKRPGQPFGLKLMHVLSQPAVSSPCEELRCSHLCLLAPPLRGRPGVTGSPGDVVVKGPVASCRCPKGLLLSKDKITCSLPPESTFILLLSRTTVYQMYLHSIRDGVALKKMPVSRVLALPGVTEASGLDVSLPELSVFVADAGSVQVLKLSSSRSRQGLTPLGQILNLRDDSVTALAVDWVTSNLYWSSSGRPDLHVTSRHDGYTTSLLQGSLKGTTSIALHPPTGRLCYTAIVVADEKNQIEVACAWMDGRNKAVLWRKSSIPTSLVFSNQGNVIYWADTGESVISSIGVDGTGYRQYKTGPGLLISFTHVESILLWVTVDKDVTKLWFSDGLQPNQLWFETKTSLFEVRGYSSNSQSGANGCSKTNGGCAHLCLPHPGGRTCQCGWGFSAVEATSCAPLPDCPTGQQPCFSGEKCIESSKLCDGHADCPDESDEQDCPYSNSASNTRLPQPSPSPHPNAIKTSGPMVQKGSTSCDVQHCSGHGKCTTAGTVTGCQCFPGYRGASCQEADSGRRPTALLLGFLCLAALLLAAAYVFTKRRGWKSIRSRPVEKETLMANISLQCDPDSDTEELESPVDVKSPSLALMSLRPK